MQYPCSAIFFDLDGTLLDSVQDLADATNSALRASGLPEHPVHAYKYFVGDGFEMLIQRAAPKGADLELRLRVMQQAREAYRQNWAHTSKPYEGIPEMLEDLQKRAIPLAVLSNKPHEFTLLTMRHFFPTIRFARIQGSPPGIRAKPDPALALTMLRELGLEAHKVLFMGDTGVDMVTAVNAGMIPVGVLWGFRTEEELIRHGARLVLGKAAELFAHLEP
ncbi:MAG: HAD family hydrolase [Deltaproteobacteria bacterium]|jgi:phosphoglycolate phosphatase|nr:HAD family hydrolase [Deltaproteobacteria bacterium]